MATISPYLNFNGNCREAISFYKEALSGEVEMQTVGEMPEMASQMPAHFKDHILHAALKAGGISIYASDLGRDKQVEGNTVRLCINCGSEDEINNFFTNLSVGGKVIQPISDMPWGAKYAELEDKFGKLWIFNFQK